VRQPIGREERPASSKTGNGLAGAPRVGGERLYILPFADGPQPTSQARPWATAIDRCTATDHHEQEDADEAEVRVVLVLIEHRDEPLEPRDAAGWQLTIGYEPLVDAREPGRGERRALDRFQQLAENGEVVRCRVDAMDGLIDALPPPHDDRARDEQPREDRC
jgi:hypothetical protein